jgi:GDP-mannose 6-dehydrogenase
VPHIGSLLRADIDEVVAESDVLIVSFSDAQVLERLRTSARSDQIVIDLMRIPNRSRGLAGRGLCW